jgi:hypothetical protein
MKRHPQNPNLTLHDEHDYLGLPIQVNKGPFIKEYLDLLYLTMMRAVNQYGRVYAFRFDLHFPESMSAYPYANDNLVVERFVESMRAKIAHNQHISSRGGKRTHDTTVRYVWGRETGQLGRPHYHFCVFVNYDAYRVIGKFELGIKNMFNRLLTAWASALRMKPEDILGSVHIPENAGYLITRGDDKSFSDFFYRASYICKDATKVFNSGYHSFGASRF